MRVPTTHLCFQLVGHLTGSELAPFLRDDELERQVKQQIAQLALDPVDLPLAQRLVELQDLFDQVGAEGLAGLSSIPGTPISQIPNGRHSASKR
jgi:hypothetical protein